MSEAGGSDDSLESTVAFDRARSEERGGAHIRPSRRSKSEGPPTTAGAPPGPALSEYRLQYMNMASPPPRAVRSDSDPCVDEEMMIASYPPPAPAGPLSNAIARISTEYRLQFAWPRAGRGLSTQDAKITTGSVLPRKSLSMGAIQPVPVHKKRGADFEKNDEGASELEPLVGPEVVDTTLEELQGEEKIQHEILSKEEKPRRRKEIKTEYKKKFRPFSQYDYVEGKFLKKADAVHLPDAMPELPQSDSWYREVLELRKKAGEYKHRGWGTELVPQHIADLYNKQMALWEQVSRRSSLSALSLASTAPRSISKEEKEKENNKKSSPTKPMSSRPMRPSTAPDKFQENDKRKAEKGEITKKEIPRSRKDYLIRHHLERTTGAARSQSVGLTGDNRSPKRQPRTPLATTTQPNKMNGPVQTERRPRPSSAACGENENDVDQQLNKEEPEVEPALVKSPPEPTRVKSPEQILMRSPEPVNWTVPLDTGKTFTVTQNVHEGELTNRPHSEVKPWTPPTVPPPAPQSAPPELLEQTSGWKSPDPMTTSIVGGHEAVNGLEEEKPSTLPFQYDTSTAGTAFRHQEGPSFDKGRSGSELLETPTEMSAGSAGGGSSQDPYRILEASASTLPQESPTKPLPLVSPSSGRSLASDVLEKARTRFDKFWGKGKEPTDGKV
ncbi:hypothetical protein B7P43_G03610 [Cryptotermes secundus]|uniref:Nuclear protein MDM1 n=1 Tax=Cryptotermes secundus TaxID=105785 RepID=A0A2J7PSU7_9NEOP|nr:hypothetical protein B7P43_G03610 [Cryptotermes secundus]